MPVGNIAILGSVMGFQEQEKRALRENMLAGTRSLHYAPEELFTLVGRRYLDDQFPHKPFATPDSPAFSEVVSCRTVYYTAPVSATPSRIEREVMALSATLAYVVEAAEQASRGKDDFLLAYRLPKRTELVIVDEAQRLKMAALEQLRDLYDRLNFGLVLIGQPGLEKSLARYPQLYSRVGFAHQFRVLSEDETRWLLEERWSHLGMQMRRGLYGLRSYPCHSSYHGRQFSTDSP